MSVNSEVSRLSQMARILDNMTRKVKRAAKLEEQRTRSSAASELETMVLERNFSARISTLKRQYEQDTADMVRKLVAMAEERDRLDNELTSLRSMLQTTPLGSHKPQSMHSTFLLCFLFFLLGSLSTLCASFVASSNGFCAPLAPGSSYAQESVLEAPWWAPSALKNALHDTMCPGTPRYRLELHEETLSAFREDRHEWTKPASKVEYVGDHLLLHKGKNIKAVETPWSSDL